MSALPRRIRCREIGDADIEPIATLLTTGFTARTRGFWLRAFQRLAEHPTPPGYPKYGYLLEADGAPVGVLLVIFSALTADGHTTIRCNTSSWYVDPAFRGYAAMLVSRAMRHRGVTYLNITPNTGTPAILEAQGYVRYCTGRFVAAALLCPRVPDAHVELVGPDCCTRQDLQPSEVDLLLSHRDYGCVALTCRSRDRRHPFVFLPRKKAGVIPFAYLAYCRDIEEFVRFAGPLGRFLARRGFPLVVLDANRPIAGLIGRYSDGAPKYFKGPNPPRLGDMAYTERVMFGF